MRIAILQIERYHEEIVPSLVHAFGAGVTIDAFLNRRCGEGRGELFSQFPDLNCTIHYVPTDTGADLAVLGVRIDAGVYDAICASTFQNDITAQFVKERGLPVLGVVHNVLKFMRSERCQAVLASGLLRPLVMAPHVAAFFHSLTKGAWIDRLGVVVPGFWGRPGTGPSPDQPRGIVVPGGVKYEARSFEALFRALDKGAARALRSSGAQIQVVGGGRDHNRVKEAVEEGGFEDVMTLVPMGPNGLVGYKDYLAALRGAWALHPLTPAGRLDYRQFKITSAVPTSIGFRLPMVMDRWTAAVYRVPGVVTDASPAAGLRALLTLTGDDVSRVRADLDDHAAAMLSANSADVLRLLAQVAG